MMSRIVILFLLFFTFLFSEEAEEFPFLGLAVSGQTIDINSQDENQNTIALRYGQQTMDVRTMFTYEFKGSGYQSLAVELDKILVDDFLGTPKIRPYLGVTAAALKYKEDTLIDTSGYYYGANAGFIFYGTDTMDLDISYHYYIVQEIEGLDSIRGITLSLHYFF